MSSKRKNDKRKHFKICKQSFREHGPKTQAKAEMLPASTAHRFMYQRGSEPALSVQGLSHARHGATAAGLRCQETVLNVLNWRCNQPCGWWLLR